MDIRILGGDDVHTHHWGDKTSPIDSFPCWKMCWWRKQGESMSSPSLVWTKVWQDAAGGHSFKMVKTMQSSNWGMQTKWLTTHHASLQLFQNNPIANPKWISNNVTAHNSWGIRHSRCKDRYAGGWWMKSIVGCRAYVGGGSWRSLPLCLAVFKCCLNVQLYHVQFSCHTTDVSSSFLLSHTLQSPICNRLLVM